MQSGIGFIMSLTLMALYVLGKDHDGARLGLLNMLNDRLEIINLENVTEINEPLC